MAVTFRSSSQQLLLLLPQTPEDDPRSLRSPLLCVVGGRVRPSYDHGRYGVVPPRALDIVAISIPPIRLSHHTDDIL